MRPKRIFFFINGLLQIIDGITYVFCSIIRKPGTNFAMKHILYDAKNNMERTMKG